jgi:Uncharacterized protein conserved in bacteria
VARPPATCPCGLPQPYAQCCGRFHRAEASAPTAELLMRSRFSAFAVGDEAYLLRTWDPAARPRRVGFDPDQRWTRLEILARSAGGLFDTEGTVEFRAHHLRRGRPGVLHEHSRFRRVGREWLYIGVVEDSN